MSRSIVPNLAAHEVWFLTGSQGLYGDEVVAQVAAQSRQRSPGSSRESARPRRGRVEARPHHAAPSPVMREANATPTWSA